MRVFLVLLIVVAGLFVVGVAGYKIVHGLSVEVVTSSGPRAHRDASASSPPAAAAPTAAVAPPPAAPAASAPIVAPERKPRWRLCDDQDFTVGRPPGSLPWYAGEVPAPVAKGLFDASGQNAAVTGLLLMPSRAKPKPLALSERCPHAVKWELTIVDPSIDESGAFIGFQNKTVAFDDRGCSLVTVANVEAAMPPGPNVAVFERFGERMTCSLNGQEIKIFTVASDERLPLRAVADWAGVMITRSRVYCDGDEGLQDPPARIAATGAVGASRWTTALAESFDSTDTMRRILPWRGDVSWWQQQQALLIGTKEQGGEAFAAVHGSFPGDIRIRFRALRRKSAREVSIGVFFSTDGLTAMDGYFAEWGRGIVQLKKNRHVEELVQAPTPQTADRWVRCEVSRIGDAITMKLEDSQVLSWVDPHPPRDDRHDLCCFYVWDDSTLIDDLVIERDAAA
jgi:hypothetical protein